MFEAVAAVTTLTILWYSGAIVEAITTGKMDGRTFIALAAGLILGGIGAFLIAILLFRPWLL